MNREKRLNEAGRKRRTCLNDSDCQIGDRNHAADRYIHTSAVDINNTEVKSRPQIPNTGGYDGYAVTRLNTFRLNAEDDAISDHDLSPFHSREAGGCLSELYQGRVVSNNDGYHRHQKFSNRKKEKKNYRRDFDQTISPAVRLSTEDGAESFVDRQRRGVDRSTDWQDHTGMQHSHSNTSQNEQFYNDDHLLAAAPVTATVLASEKVFSFKFIAFILCLVRKMNFCIFL